MLRHPVAVHCGQRRHHRGDAHRVGRVVQLRARRARPPGRRATRCAASCWNRSAAGIWISCGIRDDATTLPSASAATALTELVPMSIPTVISRATACRLRRGRRLQRGEHLVVQHPVASTPRSRRRRSALPARSVNRPPASSTITSSGARSQSATIGSAAMSAAPSATRMWLQKSPKPRVRQHPARQRVELGLQPELLPPLEVAVAELRVFERAHLRHADRRAVRERASPAHRPPACARARAPTRRRRASRRPPRAPINVAQTGMPRT